MIIKKLNIYEKKPFTKYRFRCNYCGKTQYTTLWLLKIKLIFKDKIYKTCPYCHYTSCYTHFFHLNHDSTDKKEKEVNKQKLWDNRVKR